MSSTPMAIICKITFNKLHLKISGLEDSCKLSNSLNLKCKFVEWAIGDIYLQFLSKFCSSVLQTPFRLDPNAESIGPLRLESPSIYPIPYSTDAPLSVLVSESVTKRLVIALGFDSTRVHDISYSGNSQRSLRHICSDHNLENTSLLG